MDYKLKLYQEGRQQAIEEIKKIIDELTKDPNFPTRDSGGRISNRFERIIYISEKYPYLTEGIKKNIEQTIALKEIQGLR